MANSTSAKIKNSHPNHSFYDFSLNHHRTYKNNLKERQKTIELENEDLLRKIVTINNRKGIKTLGCIISNKTNFSHKNLQSMINSFKNINEANKKIASSLSSSFSNLRQQTLSKSFFKHQEIQQRITRYSCSTDGKVELKQIKSLKRLKTAQTHNPEEKVVSRLFCTDPIRKTRR